MFGGQPVGQDLRGIAGARPGHAERAFAGEAQQLAVDRHAGTRVDLVERHRVAIIGNRERIAAEIELRIGTPVGMGDVAERTDLERAGRHDPVAAQEPARHRQHRADAEEAAVGAGAFLQPVGHRDRQVLDHPLTHIG